MNTSLDQLRNYYKFKRPTAHVLQLDLIISIKCIAREKMQTPALFFKTARADIM